MRFEGTGVKTGVIVLTPQAAVYPPSTKRIVPVTYEAASEARNTPLRWRAAR
jgi:hypothetical protein